VLVQVPPVQTSPLVVQSVQAMPPTPHCVLPSLVTQMSPAQQPVQFMGPHIGGWLTQSPVAWLQNSFIAEQLVQASPPVPHCESLSVGTQVDPAQQPLQLFGPHGALTHDFEPGSHCCPVAVQSTHTTPPLPHASDEAPETHAG
jgi:hypothetical protein